MLILRCCNNLAEWDLPGAQKRYITGVQRNHLFFGDNLDVLRNQIGSETVDLVYLDPPFNSNRNYSVIFKRADHHNEDDTAQIQAFEDTWHWMPATEENYLAFLVTAPQSVADALTAFRGMLGENDAMAYLVNMTPRLVELYRVLKPTGSLYLHCDPTMSHYLKVLLDAIFGPRNFRNEIIWQRVAAKGSQMNRLPANHDVILNYAKSTKATWNELRQPYDPANLDAKTLGKYAYTESDGRRYRLGPLLHPEQGKRPNLDYELMGVRRTWRWSKERMDAAVAAGRVVQTAPGTVPQQKMYLDEQPGRLIGDVWTDISVLNSQAKERLGYPTQKPVALLERILRSSSNEGDVVLDPFCGCGTTVDAAQRQRRRWIGIDITYIAVDLIRKRLRHTYGDDIEDTFDITGIPRDLGSARALFNKSPFEFERWAVSLVGAEPNQRQVGDKGIDGTARFPIDRTGRLGKILISVKGGKSLNPAMVRDLRGTVDRTTDAHMGILVTLTDATRGVRDEIDHGGIYTHPANGQTYPRLQHITIGRLLLGEKPVMPPTVLPYIPAARHIPAAVADALF